MARKKITLDLIKNKTNRRASFRKRKKGLIKKVSEITTLCDVDACAIIFSPYDQKPEVWPSPEGALAVLARYGAISGIYYQSHKEVDIESFTLQRMNKTQQKLDRLCNQNKRSDLELFMYQCIGGMNRIENLDVCKWADMSKAIDQVIRDVMSKMGRFVMEGGADSQAIAAPPPQVDLMDQPPFTRPESNGLDWDIEALLYPR